MVTEAPSQPEERLSSCGGAPGEKGGSEDGPRNSKGRTSGTSSTRKVGEAGARKKDEGRGPLREAEADWPRGAKEYVEDEVGRVRRSAELNPKSQPAQGWAWATSAPQSTPSAPTASSGTPRCAVRLCNRSAEHRIPWCRANTWETLTGDSARSCVSVSRETSNPRRAGLPGHGPTARAWTLNVVRPDAPRAKADRGDADLGPLPLTRSRLEQLTMHVNRIPASTFPSSSTECGDPKRRWFEKMSTVPMSARSL